jgi:hypothetical protein
MLKAHFVALGAVAALTATMASASLPAQAKVSQTFYGRITHVSEDNIKVQDPATGKTMSFVFVPGAAKIVEDTGNPQKMADVHPGEPVKIIYDTTALGARHLDRIVTLHNGLPGSYHNRY